MRKYGGQCFTLFILEHCASPDNLDAREVYWVEFLNTMTPGGYNLKAGGGVMIRTSPEVGRKISVALEGREITPEWRENISKGRKGKKFGPMSAQGRKNIGDAGRGRKDTDETRQKKSAALKDRPREPRPTDAARNAKIAATLTGRKLSLETVARRSAKQAGTPWITNGIESRRLKHGEVLPANWRYGRIFPYDGEIRGK